jgi:hypothetical protein
MNLETMTACDFLGVPNSLTELRERYFNMLITDLRDECLLAGAPSCWLPELLSHFEKTVLPQINGWDSFEEFKTLALQMMRDLLFETVTLLADETESEIEILRHLGMYESEEVCDLQE